MVFSLLLKPENSTLVPLWDVKTIPHCASASISTVHNLISSNANRDTEHSARVRERERRDGGRERGGRAAAVTSPVSPDVRTHLQQTEKKKEIKKERTTERER